MNESERPRVSEDFLPCTDCARVALLGNYKNCKCLSCRTFYSELEFQRQRKWFVESLGNREVPEEVIENCFNLY